jgi:hypothetical protein
MPFGEQLFSSKAPKAEITTRLRAPAQQFRKPAMDCRDGRQ